MKVKGDGLLSAMTQVSDQRFSRCIEALAEATIPANIYIGTEWHDASYANGHCFGKWVKTPNTCPVHVAHMSRTCSVVVYIFCAHVVRTCHAHVVWTCQEVVHKACVAEQTPQRIASQQQLMPGRGL